MLNSPEYLNSKIPSKMSLIQLNYDHEHLGLLDAYTFSSGLQQAVASTWEAGGLG